jgi:hypothetical protein
MCLRFGTPYHYDILGVEYNVLEVRYFTVVLHTWDKVRCARGSACGSGMTHLALGAICSRLSMSYHYDVPGFRQNVLEVGYVVVV